MKKILLLIFIIISIFSCVKKDNGIINKFYNYPNPFGPSDCSETTTFRAMFKSDLQGSIGSFKYKLTVYVSGKESKVYESEYKSVNIGGAMTQFEFGWNGRANPSNNTSQKVKGGSYTSVFVMKILTDNGGNPTEAEYSSKTTTVIGACP